MPPIWYAVAGGSVLVFAVAFVAVGGHHEIAYRIRIRRRRRVPVDFGGRRL